ncbi:MAG TPA: paraquat-inducible protein A [Usitatibacter sp.]|nr:paraquat-inducible protein A [Usitatibacter sp.]
MTMKTNGLLACPECDALQREVPLPRNGCAECVRCGADLERDKPHSLDRTLAFMLAAAVLFAIANTYPLMELDAQGIQRSATLLDTSRALYEHDMPSVALLVLMTAIVVPAIELAVFLYMLLPLRLRVIPDGLPTAFRIAHAVRPWGMVDVFILGALVSLVKLTEIATVYPGVALYALGGYILLLTAGLASFEPHALWQRAEALQDEIDAVRA